MALNLTQMFRVQDKFVVVTVGCGGIGSDLAAMLSELGAPIAIIDISEQEIADKVAEISAATGNKVMGYAADITDEQCVKETFARINADFGGIYGLINCAGITYVDFLSRMNMDRWQKVMDVNFRGTVLCTKYAGEYMAKAHVGRVINISSLASIHGKPGYTAYTPSKSAIEGFTFTLAAEWGHKGITVNAVRPVFMVSKITRAQHGDRLEEVLANARMRNPQGRTCSPEQMIGLITFLLSESSSYVDGQSIGCDGGATFGDIWAYKPEEPED